MDRIEYIKSNKGGTKIIYKGYMYTVHKNKKCGGIRWRCTQRNLNCKGSMSTTVSGSAFINMPHNHLPDYHSAATARSKSEDNLHGHLIPNLLALETAAVLQNFWGPLTTVKDSMPLEQRLKTSPEQEPVLQSQPLSPTKLKVTRQSAKPPQPSPKTAVAPDPPNEEVCLRWNSHHSNMQTSFPNILMKEQYVDATLVAEGQSLKCHRLILSSCSPYFEEVLAGISPFQHPVLFMKDIPFWVLKSLCDFMYAGEVHIFQNKLEELLAVAESLKIKGLAGKMGSPNEEVKPAETAKPVKEEKKEEKEKEVKEVKEKKRTSQHIEPQPKVTQKAIRSMYPSRKPEKVSKEALNKEGILDPLDLLEPVYEEVTKESVLPPRLKEIRGIPMKKGKLKKRKITEEREESPPPMFLSRKGTRSRPNVKIPKYYHTHYERVPDATIVREPHTDQTDPLMEVEEIKAEPLDLDDDVIEIEDNVIGFPDVADMTPHDEEIIGNYDSPLVNLSDSPLVNLNDSPLVNLNVSPLVNLNESRDKAADQGSFKKINLVSQPIILNVHSIADKSSNSVQIIDLGRLKDTVEASDKIDDPLATVSDLETDKVAEDPLNFEGSSKAAEGITITNVQSVADLEEEVEKSGDTKKDETVAESSDFRIEKVVSEKDDAENPIVQEIGAAATVSAVPVDGGETEQSKGERSVVSCAELSGEDVAERNNESKVENETQTSAVLDISLNERQAEVVPLVEPEGKVVDDGEASTTETEPVVTELGFHIAKVASEQFTVNDSVDSAVISENCADELGFQITSVVSGQIEESDVRVSEEAEVSDPGTFPNHLSETVGDVEIGDDTAGSYAVQPESSETLSAETQFLADSLEKLLDE